MGETSRHANLATDTRPDADFEATVTFHSPPQAVFEAITTPEGITGWWVPARGSGLTGGELVFLMGTKRVIVAVDESERPSSVKWTTLLCEPEPDWVGTSITFALSPTGNGGTRLDFRHVGLTPRLECFELCQAGWSRFLPSLVAFVDTGFGKPRSAS